MKYMLLMYNNPAEAPTYTAEEQKAVMQEWFAFNTEAQAAGVMVSYDGLAPVTEARSLKVRGGEAVITDGPFAETREQLGGFYILDCKDIDEALAWAAKIPSAQYGTIEVRPDWTQGVQNNR